MKLYNKSIIMRLEYESSIRVLIVPKLDNSVL